MARAHSLSLLARIGRTAFLRIAPLIVVGLFVAANRVDAAEPTSVTPTARVMTGVILRSDLTTDGSRNLGALMPGETATVLDSVPGWYHVQLGNGRKGFVSKRWVKSAEGTPFRLHMVDVGTGDGIILDMGDVEIVIDGGMNSTPFREYVNADPANPIIQWPIELAIVTHADSDHWKGLDALLDTPQARAVARPILEFWEPGYSRSCSALESYDRFIDRIRGIVPASRFLRPLSNAHRPASDGGQVVPFTVPGVPGVQFTLLHADANPP